MVFCVLVVFGVLILRLWFLQIVSGSTYRAKSENNRIRLIDIPPSRGLIFDRNGKMLVGNRPSYDLLVIPEEIQGQGQLLANLNRLAGIDIKDAEQSLTKAARTYPFKPICLKRDICRDELAMIETHRFGLPGVMIKVTPQRHYFFGSLASHLLGYLGEIDEKQLRNGECPRSKQGDLVGKSGIERKLQTYLSGTRGGEQVEVDAVGRKIRTISRKPPRQGANAYLTIDKELQAVAEKALNGRRGAVVAMDPRNGEILALASSPSFDPNLFVAGIDRANWTRMRSSEEFPFQNRALSGQYSPASVFKIVVALAALQEGVITPEEEVVCRGVHSMGEQRFRCWKKHGHGKVNLYRALVESCNVYFYIAGKKLGVDKIADYAKRFGLGKKTGFDAYQEKGGLVPTSAWKQSKFGVPWQAGETLSVSIGQSFLLVTPIQMANLISAVFNGGFLYRPEAIRWVGRSYSDKLLESSPHLLGRVDIHEEYLELVKRALEGVTNEPGGTGLRAGLNGIKMAGKTGTAQVAATDKNRADSSEVPLRLRDHAWFVDVAPASQPRIALAIIIEHGGHGGHAAAPIAKEMINAYLGDGT